MAVIDDLNKELYEVLSKIYKHPRQSERENSFKMAIEYAQWALDRKKS